MQQLSFKMKLYSLLIVSLKAWKHKNPESWDN